MGAKTALLAFADRDLATVLRQPPASERAQAEALVRQVLPGHTVTDAADTVLAEECYPDDERVYATVLGTTAVLCDPRLLRLDPFQPPEHLLDLAAGRRMILHAMHSGSDRLTVAVWDDGVLTRALSLSPDAGIAVNVGEPWAFEQPYWAGEHPVTPMPGWPSPGPYPLPFHPLALGEEFLRALFGFILEGHVRPEDVDPYTVPVHGFTVTDPSGREQAERQAMLVLARQMRCQRFRLAADGTLVEVGES